MPVIISISGGVGVGKSTLAAGLARRVKGAVVVPEHVETMHFLPRFYADRERFALHSRLEFLALKARHLKQAAARSKISILDRSLPELVTFARALLANGTMSIEEFNLYKELYDILLDALPKVDLVVWMRASPETMMSRIAVRGRKFEKHITPAYLVQIDEEYASWYATLRPTKALCVDTTSSRPSETIEQVGDWIERAAT
jgi:deoxyguanosine kinase